ncbi:ATP-binding cassette domain-containing protein [Streptomyces sp. SID8361]|uniref:ATP-binding cassette domain-containing protein n=1 Tax=Streptomyces sp. MnatMP-M27 TaxID=1839768 RepID=UPI00081EBC85|nr:ATP-binding cassette domain-containing protein [Streptomyces sp. MnatMP-M27]MYU11636.1 ATP-binding cassette domain-containing protein [Streptomyces sp. SID8361]SCF83466.1 monosaccharide ABC transporter ATP-binding protein, CUT2 family [Streptomyces sp. MnatMP-M27]
MSAPALRLRGVRKYFGSVSALEDVRFDAYAGEVHAIVGDNGAGKSTTIKIVTGIHRADAGEVLVNGEELGHVTSAAAAQEHGIAVVYQDLALVECLDIAHNMALGKLPRKFGIVLDRRRMEREAAQVLKDLKVRVGDVRTPVGLLSGGQRQVVAVARAVRMDKPIILLDEPTAALGVQETAHVGGIIDELRASGKAVIIVSHDLDFVFSHADRVTVLRLGRTVGTRRVTEVGREEIVGMITGAVQPDRPDDPLHDYEVA